MCMSMSVSIYVSVVVAFGGCCLLRFGMIDLDPLSVWILSLTTLEYFIHPRDCQEAVNTSDK